MYEAQKMNKNYVKFDAHFLKKKDDGQFRYRSCDL